MKNKTYRFAAALAILLALALVFVAPVGAAGTECANGDACTSHVAAIGTTHYDSLQDAVSDSAIRSEDSTTIILLKNVELTQVLDIYNHNLILDLNTHTLSPSYTDGSVVSISYSTVILKNGIISANGINGMTSGWGASVTITDVTISSDTNGIIVAYSNGDFGVNHVIVDDGTEVNGEYGVVITGPYAQLTVNDGAIVTGTMYGISGNGNQDGTTITINGGEITGTNYAGIYHPQNGDLTISGGTIKGDSAVFILSGSMNIEGGTFEGTSNTDAALEINNYASGGYDAITSISISDGTFKSPVKTVNSGANNPNLVIKNFISGGTFIDSDGSKLDVISDYLNPVYKQDDDGAIIEDPTKTPVASITRNGVTTKYATLQAAIDAAQNDDTITLLDDVTVTTAAHGDNALNHARAVSFTLDLNTHKLSADTGNSVFRFNIADSGATSDVTVTIKNGEIVAGGNTWCAVMSSGLSADVKAILKLEDLTIYGYRAGDLAVKAWGNGVVNAERVTIYANNGAGGFYAVGGEITLTECTVVQKGLHTAPYLSMAIAVSDGGTMTVNSGTYSAEPTAASEGNDLGSSHGSHCGGVMSSGGTLIINDGTFYNGNFGDDSLATNPYALFIADAGAVVEIKGGEFNAIGAIIDPTNNEGDPDMNSLTTISGGTFSADPTVATYPYLIKLADNHICIGPDANGMFTVEEKNPKITVTPTTVDFVPLEVGYEQPSPQTVTVKNAGNVELTLTIVKEGFANITITNLPESKTLAVSDEFSFTVLPDAGLAAGTYGGTITLSNESIEEIVISVSFTVSEPGNDDSGESPSGTVNSGGGKDTGSGNYQYYPRDVPTNGIVDFGTSKVVTGMELPAGSSGKVTLNIKPTFAMPENGFYAFEIDAPGYNLDAKINGGLSFQIPVADLEAAGWTAEDIVLFHGTVGEDGKITWEALPTNLVKNENGVASYKAAINGCSPFYIGFVKDGSVVNTEVVDPVTPPTEEPDVPGEDLPDIPGVQDEPEEPSSPAPILAVLAGLGAAVVLRRK